MCDLTAATAAAAVPVLAVELLVSLVAISPMLCLLMAKNSLLPLKYLRRAMLGALLLHIDKK